MDLHDTTALAHTLMAEHGIDQQGWTFAFDDATRRMGQCQYAKKRITVSRHYAQAADEAHVRDTILHEIAHALTPRAKHGPRWKAVALRLGATPKACGDNPFVDSDGEVAKRLASVAGKPFVRIAAPGCEGNRYRILRENGATFKLIGEDGSEVRAAKTLVYPDGEAPPSREDARNQERQRNLDAVRGRQVYRVDHRSYADKRFAILRPATARTRALLVDLATGNTLRAPQSMVKPVQETGAQKLGRMVLPRR